MEAISPGDKRPFVDSDACTECFGRFGDSQCIIVCPAPGAIVVEIEAKDVLANRFATRGSGGVWDTWVKTESRVTRFASMRSSKRCCA